jgi:hypothetical protein
MTAPPVDKSKPYIPLAGGASDGWSNEEEATATCFCGAVQLKFVGLPFLFIYFRVADPRFPIFSQPKARVSWDRSSATVATAEKSLHLCSRPTSSLPIRT